MERSQRLFNVAYQMAQRFGGVMVRSFSSDRHLQTLIEEDQVRRIDEFRTITYLEGWRSETEIQAEEDEIERAKLSHPSSGGVRNSG